MTENENILQGNIERLDAIQHQHGKLLEKALSMIVEDRAQLRALREILFQKQVLGDEHQIESLSKTLQSEELKRWQEFFSAQNLPVVIQKLEDL